MATARLKIPRHIAIIMDGNGRWANQRGHSRIFGHVRGASRVRPILEYADEIGVEALTLYAFSTENWKRPATERAVLWKLLGKFVRKEIEHLDRKNVQLHLIGEIDRLGKKEQDVLYGARDRLAKNNGIKLVFALSYGSQAEILRATQQFAQDCLQGKRKPEDLDESTFAEYLWTDSLGDLAKVDLVIRTSGEQRLSNFLLWQAAYAEFFFSPVMWPDFDQNRFMDAINSFSARDRRFGGLLAPGAGQDLPEVPLG